MPYHNPFMGPAGSLFCAGCGKDLHREGNFYRDDEHDSAMCYPLSKADVGDDELEPMRPQAYDPDDPIDGEDDS